MITTNYICIENATAEHPESKICFASVFQANERRQDSEGHPKAEIIKGDKTGRQDWETRRQQIWKNTVVEHQDLIHWEVRIPIADAIWGTIEAGVLNNIGRRWSLCQREHRNARMYIYIYVYIVKESRIIFTSSITCIHIATENFCLLEGTDLQMDLTFCNPMTLVVFHPLCQCVQYDPILK